MHQQSTYKVALKLFENIYELYTDKDAIISSLMKFKVLSKFSQVCYFSEQGNLNIAFLNILVFQYA